VSTLDPILKKFKVVCFVLFVILSFDFALDESFEISFSSPPFEFEISDST